MVAADTRLIQMVAADTQLIQMVAADIQVIQVAVADTQVIHTMEEIQLGTKRKAAASVIFSVTSSQAAVEVAMATVPDMAVEAQAVGVDLVMQISLMLFLVAVGIARVVQVQFETFL